MKQTYKLILIIAIGVNFAFAQTIIGNLEGRVVNAQSAPIMGVNIRITSVSLQGVRGAATDINGRFRIPALPVGEYEVQISNIAYQPMRIQNIVIRLGKTTTVGTVYLQEQILQMPEVIVQAARPIIDPVSTEEGGNLTARTIAQLPIERNYRNAAALLPQANISYLGDAINMAGATGLENKYIIDGMNVTDPHYFRTGTNLPYNFVQEIEIKTGGYQAEFGGTLGGVVNVITYSGENDFHGQVFGFFANNRFTAEPRQPLSAPPKGDFAQYDVGFRVGGPIVHNKLWFFAAYNPTMEQEQVLIPGLGYYTDHSTIHSFAGKLTWQVGENKNLKLTIFGDPQVRGGVGDLGGSFGTPASFANPDPYLMDISRGGVNVSLQGQHILNDHLLIESNISLLTRQDKDIPATARGRTEPLYIDATGRWSGGAGLRTNSLSTVTTLSAKATYITGQHTFKTGVELRNNRMEQDYSGLSVQATGPTNYFKWTANVKGTVQNRLPCLFIQDAWQITPHFNIQAGLRWEGEYFIASTGKVAQTITDMFQPRVGLVFQPGKIGQSKIFASFGRFYQEISTWMATFNFIEGSYSYFGYYSHDPVVDPNNPDQFFEFKNIIRPALKDLSGRYYDAFLLGYERQIFSSLKAGLYGTYHTLRQIIEDGTDPITGDSWFNNPGKGVLKLYPKAKREYTALEVTLEKPYDGPMELLVSYVLSRTYGNYTGLFNSDMNWSVPENGAYDVLEILEHSTGLLPNHRTHVFKFSGSRRFFKGLQAGFFAIWESGTPLNEFGGSTVGPPYYRFMRQRGTAGRTPSIWDINLRFVYDIGNFLRPGIQPRLILDAFHIASRRTPVNYEQIHYFNLDENGQNINPNPLYGKATRFQPPMAIRLGMEVNF